MLPVYFLAKEVEITLYMYSEAGGGVGLNVAYQGAFFFFYISHC